MSKISGVLMFDVVIEEQESEGQTDLINRIRAAIRGVEGVDDAMHVDSDIEEINEDLEED